MATTLSAKKLREALAKAKNIGLVEESFTVMGLPLVLRNLRPDEQAAAIADANEKDGAEYLYAFQKEHVCRAIVEIDGTSFRDVDFIEDEIEDPKTPGKTKVVKLERHRWIHDQYVNTWGEKMLAVVYRKFGDTTFKAEQAAGAGVEFLIPDETPEDKFRRLLTEAKEAAEDVPAEIAEHLLGTVGYGLRVTAEEAKSASDRLARLAAEQGAAEAAETPPPAPQEAAPAPPPPVPAPVPEAPPQPAFDAEAAMRSRVPRTRGNQAAEARTPKPRTTEQIAAMESLPGVDEGPPTPHMDRRLAEPLAPRPDEVPELAHKLARPDPSQARFDPPPVAGINPRYRPRQT